MKAYPRFMVTKTHPRMARAGGTLATLSENVNTETTQLTLSEFFHKCQLRHPLTSQSSMVQTRNALPCRLMQYVGHTLDL